MGIGVVGTISNTVVSVAVSPVYPTLKVMQLVDTTIREGSVDKNIITSTTLSFVPFIGPMLSNHFENTGSTKDFYKNSVIQQVTSGTLLDIPRLIFNAMTRKVCKGFTDRYSRVYVFLSILMDEQASKLRDELDEYRTRPTTEKFLSIATNKDNDIPFRQFVRIQTKDGRHLDARLVLREEGKFDAKTMVLYHGNGSGPERFGEEEIKYYVKLGYNVFIPSYAGDPVFQPDDEKQNLWTECSEERLMLDAEAHAQFLLDLGVKTISVYAHSLGGCLALLLAERMGKSADIHTIVLDRTFTSAINVVKRFVGNILPVPLVSTLVQRSCLEQIANEQHRSGVGDGLDNEKKILNLGKYCTIDTANLVIIGSACDSIVGLKKWYGNYDSSKDMSHTLHKTALKAGFKKIHHIMDTKGTHSSAFWNKDSLILIDDKGESCPIESAVHYIKDILSKDLLKVEESTVDNLIGYVAKLDVQ